MAYRPTWQGHLKLSLVTCPVALYTATTQANDVAFNMLHKDTHNRIRMIPLNPEFEEWNLTPEEFKVIGEFVARLRIRTPSLDQEIGKLSGGNQQKVVLARWLAARPRVLMLDEPTRGIDVGAKAEIYRLIDELANEGLGIVLISSELPEILGLCDRIYVMQGGRITGELIGAEATEEKVLALAMAEHLTTVEPTTPDSSEEADR